MSELGWLTQPAVFPWAALALGLCVGSFLNVVIYRLPRIMERAWQADCAEFAGNTLPEQGRYNLFVPRSACPACSRKLRLRHNIPLISWLALRGRCADCRSPISPRYPAVELLAGLGAAWAGSHFGFGLAAAGAMLFIWCAIALAFIDQATGYLPDDLTLPLLWAGLLLNISATYVPLGEAVLGAVVGYLTLWGIYWGFRFATGKEGMGYGDFKLNAAIGAFVGWKLLPLVILLSSVLGLIAGVAQMIAARGRWDSGFRFHFGPYLAIAGVVALFWGGPILRWYLLGT